MPLSDLFKKPSKKEPEKTTATRAVKPSTDESFFSPEMQKQRYDAAIEFLKLFQEKLPLVGGKPHAGTVLAIAARLAGSSLYRALNSKLEIKPGMVVLSEQVNEAWPQLMNLFAFYSQKNGMDIMARPLVTNFPDQDKPLMDVEHVLLEYQDQYHEVMQKHGLDYLNGARAGMVVCSTVFEHHTKVVKDIDPYVAAGIIAMGIVEGAKTAPPPLGAQPLTDSAGRVKNKDRLVLGERDAAIQEALVNGGAFVDLHPEVLAKLQAANIDPYLIYEKALLNKIEEKIGRIDFAKANVDALFEEWKGKPYDRVPIYIRLIFWLKDNAAQHGYIQSGNSWIRQ